MNPLRLLLIVAVVAGACFASYTYSEHHEVTNEEAFEGLYMHLMPAPLLWTQPHHGAGHAGDGEHSSAPQTPLMDSDQPGGALADPVGPAESAVSTAGPKDYIFAPTLAFLPSIMDGAPDIEGTQLVLTNLQLFQLASVLLIFIAFSGVPGYLRTGRGDWLARVLSGWVLFIRDEMVVPNLGKDDGRRFLPFFCALFFFIIFMNVMGLVPFSATPTANVFVTMALALVTGVSMVALGMAGQGPLAFWKNLVPHVPGWMWPMMFVIEVVGLLIKPFALMIRLFANMTGGHMVVLSFMGLIFFAAGSEMRSLAWGVSIPAVGFGVFIMIIEAFVAMLQAYIFTQLSCLFVGASLHPDH